MDVTRNRKAVSRPSLALGAILAAACNSIMFEASLSLKRLTLPFHHPSASIAIKRRSNAIWDRALLAARDVPSKMWNVFCPTAHKTNRELLLGMFLTHIGFRCKRSKSSLLTLWQECPGGSQYEGEKPRELFRPEGCQRRTCLCPFLCF